MARRTDWYKVGDGIATTGGGMWLIEGGEGLATKDRIATRQTTPSFKATGGEAAGTYDRTLGEYNGAPLYGNSGGAPYLFLSIASGKWTIADKIEPASWPGLEEEEILGDWWYEGPDRQTGLPAEGETVDFAPKGTLVSKGATPPPAKLTFFWPRTKKTEIGKPSDKTLAGKYDQAIDGGDISGVFGQELYSSRLGDFKSVDPDYWRDPPEYVGTGGRIYDDGVGWIIGERDLDVWFEGSQPSTGGSVTFNPFTRDPDTGDRIPAPDIEAVVVTFEDYIEDEVPVEAYITEVATWR